MYSDNTLKEIADFLADKASNATMSLGESNVDEEYKAGFQAGFNALKTALSKKISEMNNRLDEFEEEVETGQIRLSTFDEIPGGDEITADDLAEKVADRIVENREQELSDKLNIKE